MHILTQRHLRFLRQVPAFSHRVLIALEDAKAEYTLHNFDIWRTRPEWFNNQVNPLGKVLIFCYVSRFALTEPSSSQIPALTYGGPKTAPEQPSPESAKLSESLALIEFVESAQYGLVVESR